MTQQPNCQEDPNYYKLPFSFAYCPVYQPQCLELTFVFLTFASVLNERRWILANWHCWEMRDLPDWLQGGPLTSLLSMPSSPVRSEIQRPIRLEFESDSIKSSLWSSKIPAAPVFYLGFLVFLHPGINTGLEKNAFKGSNLKLTKKAWNISHVPNYRALGLVIKRNRFFGFGKTQTQTETLY